VGPAGLYREVPSAQEQGPVEQPKFEKQESQKQTVVLPSNETDNYIMQNFVGPYCARQKFLLQGPVSSVNVMQRTLSPGFVGPYCERPRSWNRSIGEYNSEKSKSKKQESVGPYCERRPKYKRRGPRGSYSSREKELAMEIGLHTTVLPYNKRGKSKEQDPVGPYCERPQKKPKEHEPVGPYCERPNPGKKPKEQETVGPYCERPKRQRKNAVAVGPYCERPKATREHTVTVSRLKDNSLAMPHTKSKLSLNEKKSTDIKKTSSRHITLTTGTSKISLNVKKSNDIKKTASRITTASARSQLGVNELRPIEIKKASSMSKLRAVSNLRIKEFEIKKTASCISTASGRSQLGVKELRPIDIKKASSMNKLRAVSSLRINQLDIKKTASASAIGNHNATDIKQTASRHIIPPSGMDQLRLNVMKPVDLKKNINPLFVRRDAVTKQTFLGDKKTNRKTDAPTVAPPKKKVSARPPERVVIMGDEEGDFTFKMGDNSFKLSNRRASSDGDK